MYRLVLQNLLASLDSDARGINSVCLALVLLLTLHRPMVHRSLSTTDDEVSSHFFLDADFGGEAGKSPICFGVHF